MPWNDEYGRRRQLPMDIEEFVGRVDELRYLLTKALDRLRHAVPRTVQSNAGSADGGVATEALVLDAYGASTEIGELCHNDLHVYIDVTGRTPGWVHM